MIIHIYASLMITTCLSNMEMRCAYNKMPLTNVAFSWSGLLLASCLYNTVTHLSSDYSDYLHFVGLLVHTRWLSLNNMSHIPSPPH